MNSIQNKLAFRRIENDVDRQHYLDIRAALRPDRATNLEYLAQEDASMPQDKFFERYLIIENDQPVAAMSVIQVFWSSEPGLYDVWFGLKGDISRQAAKFGLDQCTAIIKEQGAIKSNIWTATEFPNVIAEIESHGYKFDQANPESILHLADLDLTPFQSAIDNLNNSGLRIFSLKQLLEEDPENGFARYHELDIRLTQDVPLPYEFTGEPLDSFVKGFMCEEKSFPFIQIVADRDHLVATSMLFQNKVDGRYFGTGLTGVDRAYRRRGIAKAIKAINFNLAKQAGGTQITCDNEENNPMLQLNYDLGFKPYWVWHSYSKLLD